MGVTKLANWLKKLFGGGKGEEPDQGQPRPDAGSELSPLERLSKTICVTRRRLAFVLYHDPQPYREIRIQKRDGRTRLIHAPSSARKHV